MPEKQKIERLVFETYLTVINNSVGSKMFRNFYMKVSGKKTDVMKNGGLSCAFFVSSVLAIFGFIKGIHGTVEGTVRDLKKSGWKEIKKPRIGSVLVWEEKIDKSGEAHKHIGFYIGNDMAISNSSKQKAPAAHQWEFNGKRKIKIILWNEKYLNKPR